MKNSILLILCTFFISICFGQKKRIIGDCSITYSITNENNALGKSLSGKKVVYIKGKNVRVDIISPQFAQSLIMNANRGNIVILKEIGANKYMMNLDENMWNSQNKRFTDMSLQIMPETKTILNYSCNKAIAVLGDGSSFSLFFTPDIIPSVSENPYQFQKVPGLVLEYESPDESNNRIRYTATSVNFNPVPAEKFVIPTSGYRIIKE